MSRWWERTRRTFRSQKYEYFLYFSVVSAAIIVILAGTVYTCSAGILRRTTVRANEETLNQMINAQDVIISEVDKSFAGMVMDPGFLDFDEMYRDRGQGNVQLSIRRVQDKLSGIVQANAYIDSIAIYYLNNQLILSSDTGVCPLDTYYDREFLQTQTDLPEQTGQVVSRRKTVFSSDSQTPVLSMIKHIPIIHQGRPVARVVINMRAAYLKKMVDSMDIAPDSRILITDDAGSVLYQRQPETDTLPPDIRFDTDADGKAHPVDAGSTGLMMSAQQSDRYGWWYVYLVPEARVTAPVRSLLAVTAVVSLGLVLLSMFVALFFSHRIYRPISGILGMFSRGNSQETAGRETDRIRSEVLTLMDKNQNLEGLLAGYELFRKRTFLHSLVRGTWEEDEKTAETLAYYGLNLKIHGWFVVLVVSIDRYHIFTDAYSEKQRNMLFVFLSGQISEAALSRYPGFLTDPDENQLVLVLNPSEVSSAGEAAACAEEAARQVHLSVSEHFRYTLTVGVSSVRQGIRELADGFREAVAAVNYRMVAGYSQIIFYPEVAAENTRLPAYPHMAEQRFMAGLRAGDREMTLQALELFGQASVGQGNLYPEYIRYHFVQLLSAASRDLTDVLRGDEGLVALQSSLCNALMTEETAEGMIGQLTRFVTGVLEYSSRKKASRHGGLAGRVFQYIDENIGGDLSAERLAEVFELSASHMRKLFRDETGLTLKEYIDDKRLEKARQMLENPDIRIGDIAGAIGYLSPQTFNRAFKMAVGLTPGEYRLQARGRKTPGDETGPVAPEGLQ